MNVSGLGSVFVASDTNSHLHQNGGLLGDLKGAIGDTKNGIENELKELKDKTTGEITKALGIPEWYSLHVMNICEGSYTLNPTDNSAALNTSKCTRPNSIGKSIFSYSYPYTKTS